jgi:hypothetical protein
MADIVDFNGMVDSGKSYMAWIGNGFHLVRAIREIRRGKNKGRFEIKYLRGRKIKKLILSRDMIVERGETK